jgi:hypothetical protein
VENGTYVVSRLLVRPVVRALPWTRMTLGAGLGLLLAGLPRVLPGAGSPSLGLALLRSAALCFAAGLTFLLDDPARRTTEAVPTGRPLRAGLRVALVVPVAVAWWTAALLLVPAGIRPPIGAVSLEAGTVVGCALALSAAAVRWTANPEPGGTTMLRLLTLAAVAAVVPDRWGLLVGVGDDRWGAAHGRWAGVLVAGLVAWAVCVPEPLRRRSVGRRSVRRLRPRPSG